MSEVGEMVMPNVQQKVEFKSSFISESSSRLSSVIEKSGKGYEIKKTGIKETPEIFIESN